MVVRAWERAVAQRSLIGIAHAGTAYVEWAWLTGRTAGVEGVAAVVDVPNSAVALAVNQIMKEKDRAFLASSTATSDLTG